MESEVISVDQPAASGPSNIMENRIIELAGNSDKGISNTDIEKEFPNSSPDERMEVINKLLSKGKIDLFNKDGNLMYKLRNMAKKPRITGDNEEQLVYQHVEQAGNKGIWIRDIRNKTNILTPQLSKILKALENKKHIKAVKSVAASRKKVYMLYDLAPHPTVTGGAWYSEHEFESDFVEMLNQQCYNYLKAKKDSKLQETSDPLLRRDMSYASPEELVKYIAELKVSMVPLSNDDMETILNTLWYDGKVERVPSEDETFKYRAIEPLLPSASIMHMPCGACPVIRNCSDTGAVTPVKCSYMSEWLG